MGGLLMSSGKIKGTARKMHLPVAIAVFSSFSSSFFFFFFLQFPEEIVSNTCNRKSSSFVLVNE